MSESAASLRDKIQQMTIADLHHEYRSGGLTVEQITRFFLDRIEASNPVLAAVIAVNPSALSDAVRMDQRLGHGDTQGLLFGVPVLIKDNIETLELPTTAGSVALADNRTNRDAALVARLRNEGAIILGKTNLSEWANFRSTTSSSGWSAMGGQARNPHDVTRSPCGSSSGSAIAVAALLAWVAIGTETDGSIVCPAGINGVVGVKPTVGLVSQQGIVPISHNQDTAGPMSRNLTDAAITLAAMASATNDCGLADLCSTNVTEMLKGLRLGVLDTSRSRFSNDTLEVFRQAQEILSGADVTLVRGISFDPYEGFRQDSFDVLLYEFKTGLNTYLEGLTSSSRGLTLEKLIDHNCKHADVELLWFGQDIFELSQAKGTLTDTAYQQALARVRRETREQGIDAMLHRHRLDALIVPTNGPAWSIDWVHGDRNVGGSSRLAAIAGYPSVTVPMGTVKHLPVGLSLIGTANDDTKLLRLARAFEAIGGVDVRLRADPW